MPNTTSSAKKEDDKAAAPPASKAEPGSKHKPEGDAAKDDVVPDKHASKKAKPSDEKMQKTFWEIIMGNDKAPKEKPKEKPKEEPKEEPKQKIKEETPEENDTKPTSGDADLDPDSSVPSSILEKGIMYFFARARVNVNIQEPRQIEEPQILILLRPTEIDAKPISGSTSDSIGGSKNCRLCVIPKMVLPQSDRDRWISYIEKAAVSYREIIMFLWEEDKTAGQRTTPARRTRHLDDGVYAITSTGRESHLVYILFHQEPLDWSKEIGLKEKGSFIISTKNPAFPGTANARVPVVAEYPKEFQKEFHSRRWIPTQPHHLDYPSVFLMIKESSRVVEKALEPQKEDQKKGNEESAEELEKLEEEDIQRMRGLSKDDSVSIYKDLEPMAKKYKDNNQIFF